MENEFEKIMSERTDNELIKIISVEREDYQPLAVEAAEKEIERRGINQTKINETKTTLKIEKTKENNTKLNTVNSGIRFLNFIIDSLTILVIIFIIGEILGVFLYLQNEISIQFFGYTILIGTTLAYYILLENKFQKTVGKFITKTKVVNYKGEKAKQSEIITRTICRAIPFDQISFVFTKNGFHDMLSKTYVVKDIKTK